MTTTNSTASPSSGGSLIQSKKGKLNIPEVKKPDFDDYNSRIEAGQQALDILYKSLNELGDQLGQLGQGNSDFLQKRDMLRTALDKAQAEMEELESDRNRLMTEIEEIARSGRDMKMKVQGLKRALNYQSSEEIDAKIREVERLMMSKRMTVPEENKLINQMRNLEKEKPLIAKYANMEIDANQFSEQANIPLRIRLDKIKDLLKAKQQQRRQLNEQMSALMQERSKSATPMKALIDQKDQIRRQIVEKRSEVNQLRDELYRRQREFEAYKAKIYRVNGEITRVKGMENCHNVCLQRAEERKQKALEKQKKDLEDQLADIEEDTWTPELQLTRQTVIYLRKLVEKSNEQTGANEAVKEEDSQGRYVPVIDGMIQVVPKNQRDEFYFAPTKKKVGKKSKRPVISLRQPLVHDLTTLQDFQKLKIATPLTLQDCPEALKILENKLEQLKIEHAQANASILQKRAELSSKLEELELQTKTIRPAVEDQASLLQS